jgi:hypothetical protein
VMCVLWFGVGLTVHGVVVWCWLDCTWSCVFGVGLTVHGVVCLVLA